MFDQRDPAQLQDRSLYITNGRAMSNSCSFPFSLNGIEAVFLSGYREPCSYSLGASFGGQGRTFEAARGVHVVNQDSSTLRSDGTRIFQYIDVHVDAELIW
jgi:hypothetical protein